MAEIIEVIEVFEPRGKGTSEDPVRNVWQLWSKDGHLLVEKDPCQERSRKKHSESGR